MLDMNPGLRDRIQFYIDFPDYSGTELLQVFEKLCGDNGYTMTNAARVTLKNGFARILAAKGKHFSNGRLVRKMFERTRIKQAIRASNDTISHLDIEAMLAEKDIAALSDQGGTIIGFQRCA